MVFLLLWRDTLRTCVIQGAIERMGLGSHTSSLHRNTAGFMLPVLSSRFGKPVGLCGCSCVCDYPGRGQCMRASIHTCVRACVCACARVPGRGENWLAGGGGGSDSIDRYQPVDGHAMRM